MSGPISNGSAPAAPAPTDLELMLWIDGELDGVRAAEVEAFVRRDARVRAVVAGLRQGGAMLAADAMQHAGARGADSIVDRVMAAVAAERAPLRTGTAAVGRKRRTAIAVGAALGLAAGVTLFIGTRRPSSVSQLAGGRPTGAVVAEGPRLADFPGAIIDVVDFGARSGTIFYVPSEGDSTTAVVWLMEDDTSPSSGESP